MTGESGVTVHWCCPDACELDDRATRTVVESSINLPDLTGSAIRKLWEMTESTDPPAEDPPRGALRFWSHEGITLPADDRGTIGAADLLEFAQLALKHYPDARIYPHAYGMRVTKSAGDDAAAPRLAGLGLMASLKSLRSHVVRALADAGIGLSALPGCRADRRTAGGRAVRPHQRPDVGAARDRHSRRAHTACRCRPELPERRLLMGMDIHSYIETFDGSAWQWNRGDLFDHGSWPGFCKSWEPFERSYGLFGFLAGMRNHDVPLIHPCRGLPDDVSPEVRAELGYR